MDLNLGDQCFSKQHNYCVKLLRKTKGDYYANLNQKNVVDNRNFWKTIKSLLSNKIKSSGNICLVEGKKVVTNDKENN